MFGALWPLQNLRVWLVREWYFVLLPRIGCDEKKPTQIGALLEVRVEEALYQQCDRMAATKSK